MKAAVIGGSGETGKCLVKALIEDPAYTEILLIGRRALPELNHDKTRQLVVNVDAIYEETVVQLAGYDVGFNAMGIGKPSKASKEELTRIDYTVPLEFARACKEAGLTQFVVLTAAGAKADAKECWVTGTSAAGGLYQGLKGRLEKACTDLGFAHVNIFRPGMLVGNANTPGLAEWIGTKVSGLVPQKYKEIHIRDLGWAMKESCKNVEGAAQTRIWEGGEIAKAFPMPN